MPRLVSTLATGIFQNKITKKSQALDSRLFWSPQSFKSSKHDRIGILHCQSRSGTCRTDSPDFKNCGPSSHASHSPVQVNAVRCVKILFNLVVSCLFKLLCNQIMALNRKYAALPDLVSLMGCSKCIHLTSKGFGTRYL